MQEQRVQEQRVQEQEHQRQRSVQAERRSCRDVQLGHQRRVRTEPSK